MSDSRIADGKSSAADIFRAAALKQRVVTAVVIASLFLAAVFWSSFRWFEMVCGAIFLIAAWEWAGLAGLAGYGKKTAYVVLVFLGMFVSSICIFQSSAGESIKPIAWLMEVAMAFWVLSLVMIVTYPKTAALWSSVIARTVLGLFVLLPAWAAMVFLKQQHEAGGLVLWVVAIIALADSGAYFAGVRFGTHKLVPQVSPGKSWEGVVGGLLCNGVLIVVLTVYWQLSIVEAFWLSVVTVMVVAFSIAGDLFESMVKRFCGVKDSGSLLPGHGGVLDRLDGWMAALPAFTFAYIVFAV